MEGALPSRRFLLLDTDASGPLAVAVRAALPGATELRTLHPQEDWPPQAAEAEVLVLATNRLDLSSLRLAHHVLRDAPGKQAVLVVGDRGLAGAEALLGLPNVRFLPEPWTTRGLEQVLNARGRDLGGDSATGELLAGVVEGLRDPLAALSGYLQLLRGEAEAGQSSLIGPALDSAREIDRLLEALELAARPARPRRETLDLGKVAARVVEQAVQEGARAELRWEGPAHSVETDLQRLQAALFVARLFLERFGPGGALVLRGGVAGGRHVLAWESAAAAPASAPSERPTRPPTFLPGVMARLAVQLGAEPLLRWRRAGEPAAAGLGWRHAET